MLSALLNVPKNKQDWEQFFWQNRNQVTQIRQAILSQLSINLTEYIIYPVDESNPVSFQEFLEQNEQAHNDFNSVLNLQSSDLESVDLKIPQQVNAWIYLNYQELYSASALLKI